MEENASFSKSNFISLLDILKEWQPTDTETYSIVKNRETAEHYLWYSLVHINLSEGGRQDVYEHFMPLDSDDVLGLMFGEQPYSFPDHWQKPYLRSGTDERLMWYDPRENFDLQKAAEEERAMFERLLQYKQQWLEASDKEELTRKLFRDLDDLKRE